MNGLNVIGFNPDRTAFFLNWDSIPIEFNQHSIPPSFSSSKETDSFSFIYSPPNNFI